MLTVIMATYNGDATLPEVLTAYTKLEPPASGWRLVVVDNGSTDATRRIIEEYAPELPITYLVETTPGKNAALNAALSAVSGDLVVFTDDDIVPNRDWLCRLRHAADAQPDFHLFGGRIVPRWPVMAERSIPAGVPLGPAFGVSPPLETGPVAHQFVYGGNMAVRADVFAQGFRFDPSIGPRRGQYAQGSEAELTRRLTSAGYRAWFCREAVVEHLIRPVQLTERWILKRARRYGRGQSRLQQRTRSRSLPRHAAAMALLSARLLRHSLRVARRCAGRDAEARLVALWTWNQMLGELQESTVAVVRRDHVR